MPAVTDREGADDLSAPSSCSLCSMPFISDCVTIQRQGEVIAALCPACAEKLSKLLPYLRHHIFAVENTLLPADSHRVTHILRRLADPDSGDPDIIQGSRLGALAVIFPSNDNTGEVMVMLNGTEVRRWSDLRSMLDTSGAYKL